MPTNFNNTIVIGSQHEGLKLAQFLENQLTDLSAKGVGAWSYGGIGSEFVTSKARYLIEQVERKGAIVYLLKKQQELSRQAYENSLMRYLDPTDTYRVSYNQIALADYQRLKATETQGDKKGRVAPAPARLARVAHRPKR